MTPIIIVITPEALTLVALAALLAVGLALALRALRARRTP